MHPRAELADRLELILRRLGRWSAAPMDAARLVDMGPFGMKTLAPEEWLQHILLPRLRSPDPLPATSELAPWLTRSLDGDPDADPLLEIAAAIDAMVADPIHATLARVTALCAEHPAIRLAHLVQLHAPHTGQLTTPALGLVLDGPLAPDAFAAWPATTHPLIVFVLGDDAISRLTRLTPPIYIAERPPPGVSELEYYR